MKSSDQLRSAYRSMFLYRRESHVDRRHWHNATNAQRVQAARDVHAIEGGELPSWA